MGRKWIQLWHVDRQLNINHSNETGFLSVFLPKEICDWEYMKLSPQQGNELVPQGDNTFELVIVVRNTCL